MIKPRKPGSIGSKKLEQMCSSLIECIKTPPIDKGYEYCEKYHGDSIYITDNIEYIDFDPYEIEDDEPCLQFNEYEFLNSDFYKNALKEWRKANPVYIAMGKVRNSISIILKKRGYVKDKRTVEILGCSEEDFAKHIESKFESWMSWTNYGGVGIKKFDFKKTWDLDHIIPISTAKTVEDVYRLNHYTNLQPLCSAINRHHKKNNLN